MTAFSLASRWFHQHAYCQHGITGSLYHGDDGLAHVFLSVNGEAFQLRGHSWSHLISRAKQLLPELSLRPQRLSAIELANAWLERELTAKHGIRVFVGTDEAGYPWIMVPFDDERYAIRGYCWTHAITRFRAELLPELIPTERERTEGQGSCE